MFLLFVSDNNLPIHFCSCGDSSESTQDQNSEALTEKEVATIDRLKECIFQIIPEKAESVQILEGYTLGDLQGDFYAFLKIKFDNIGARWYQLEFDDESGIGEGLLDKGEEYAPVGTKLRAEKITAEINKFLNDSEMQAERIDIIEKAIEEIGSIYDFANLNKVTLSLNIKPKIEIARKAYDQLLSDAEKEQVDDSAILKAEKYYDYYYDYKYAEEWATQKLKERLKNPNSLQVHSAKVLICYDSTKSTSLAFSVEIDYSAQNSFEGYTRDTFLWNFKKEDGKYDVHNLIGRLDFYNIQEENNGVIISYASQLD